MDTFADWQVPTWVMVLVVGVLTVSLVIGVPLARSAGSRRGRRLAHPELLTTKRQKATDTALFLAALVPSVLVWLAVMGVSFIGLTGFAARVMDWTHWTNMLVPLSLDGISVSFGAWAFVAVKRGRHPGRAYKIVLAAATMSAVLNFVHGRAEWSLWAGIYLAFLSFTGMAMFHELLEQFMAAYDEETALHTRYPRFGQRWLYAPFSTFAARRAWIVHPPRERLRPSIRNALEHLEQVREERRLYRLGGASRVREEQRARLVEIQARMQVKAAKRGDASFEPTEDVLTAPPRLPQLDDVLERVRKELSPEAIPPSPILVQQAPEPLPRRNPVAPQGLVADAVPPVEPSRGRHSATEPPAEPAPAAAEPASAPSAGAEPVKGRRRGAKANAEKPTAQPAAAQVPAQTAPETAAARQPVGTAAARAEVGTAAARAEAGTAVAPDAEAQVAQASATARTAAGTAAQAAAGTALAQAEAAARAAQMGAAAQAVDAQAETAATATRSGTRAKARSRGKAGVQADADEAVPGGVSAPRDSASVLAGSVTAGEDAGGSAGVLAGSATAGEDAVDSAGVLAGSATAGGARAGSATAGSAAAGGADAGSATAGSAAAGGADAGSAAAGGAGGRDEVVVEEAGNERWRLEVPKSGWQRIGEAVDSGLPLLGGEAGGVPLLFGAAISRPVLPERVPQILDAHVRPGDDLSIGRLTNLVLRALAVPANRDAVASLVRTWVRQIEQGTRGYLDGPRPTPEPAPAFGQKLEYPFEVLTLQKVVINHRAVACPDCGTEESLMFSGQHKRRPVDASCGCGQRWPIVGLGSERVGEVLANELATGQAELLRT